MERIEFTKNKIPFTQVANEVLSDKRLSAKAKGLYSYLYSKPNGWDFAIDRIALEMKDGRKAINEGLQELEALGLLTRNKKSDGRVIYTVHFPPIEPHVQNEHEEEKPDVQNGHEGEKPHARNATLPKRHIAKTGTVSNKDLVLISKDHNKNKEHSVVSQRGDSEIQKTELSVNEENEWTKIVMDVFYKGNNPTINFGNKTFRKSAVILVKRFGLDKVVRAASYAVKITNEQYAPTITNPYQLQDKLPALIKYQQNHGKSNIAVID